MCRDMIECSSCDPARRGEAQEICCEAHRYTAWRCDSQPTPQEACSKPGHPTECEIDRLRAENVRLNAKVREQSEALANSPFAANDLRAKLAAAEQECCVERGKRYELEIEGDRLTAKLAAAERERDKLFKEHVRTGLAYVTRADWDASEQREKRLRLALGRVADFGHSPSCPVYRGGERCHCQVIIARDALA